MPARGGSAFGGKLLMITRKVDRNDALAGFAWNWVKKIGENLDKFYVISWQAGDKSDLPDNIEVIFCCSCNIFMTDDSIDNAGGVVFK